MATYRVRQISDLLGVSDDTVRRWAESGRLPASRDATGRVIVAGTDLAEFADQLALQTAPAVPTRIASESSRNRLTGLVTKVQRDGLMAQVEMRCGPFRVVSIMTAEAADDLELVPGALAIASVAATGVVIEVPAP